MSIQNLTRSTVPVAVIVLTFAMSMPDGASASRTVLPGSNGGGYPSLMMNASGDYVITWRQSSTTGPAAAAHVKVLSGRIFEAFLSPTSIGGPETSEPIATVNPDGPHGFAWFERNADVVPTLAMAPPGRSPEFTTWIDGSSIVTASRTPSGFSSRQVVYTEQTDAPVFAPNVVLDGNGVPTIYWTRSGTIQVATSDGTGAFGKPQTVAVGCGEGKMVEASSGAAELFMECANYFRYTYRQPGQQFVRPIRIHLNRGNAGFSSIALLPRNRVMVVVEETRQLDAIHFSTRLKIATGALGARLSKPKPITAFVRWTPLFDQQPDPRLMIGGGGRPFLRWFRRNRLSVAEVTRSLLLVRKRTLAVDDTNEVAVAMSQRNVGIAVWTHYLPRTGSRIEATTFAMPRK